LLIAKTVGIAVVIAIATGKSQNGKSFNGFFVLLPQRNHELSSAFLIQLVELNVAILFSI